MVLYGGMYWNDSDSEIGNIVPKYDPSVYIFYFLTCPDSCNNRGTCRLGACRCNSKYYGNKCQYQRCPNILCYYDIDTIDPSECIECGGHGSCINSTCVCDPGYTGTDCTMIECAHNCSNTANVTYGYCLPAYPISQCICNETLKRGGDYCEQMFCLNNCAGNGECLVNGTCKCNQLYFGEDCSVFVYPTNFAFRYGKITILTIVFFIIILIIN